MKKYLAPAGFILASIIIIYLLYSSNPISIGMPKNEAIKALDTKEQYALPELILDSLIIDDPSKWSLNGQKKKYLIIFRADTVYSFESYRK